MISSKHHKIIWLALAIAAIIMYILLGSPLKGILFCPIYHWLHLYCPGCGIGRMLQAILHGQWYQAFRYNPLIFICLPFLGWYLYDTIMDMLSKRKSISASWPMAVWMTILAAFIVYGILRNIPAFAFLQPTTI